MFLGLMACSNPDEDFIEENRFVEILADIHLADAAASYELGKDTDNINEIYGHYSAVFEKHNTNYKDFEASYHHYASDLDRMKEILTKVQQRIRQLEKQ